MTPEELEQHKRDMLFQPLNSEEELREWVYLYLGIYFPSGVVYPTSNSSPTHSMWSIYNLFKTGGTVDCPQVVMCASRDSYKTLSAAAIEVLLFVHFQLPMAHAAAIKFQAGACVAYVNTMFRKIRPYLEYHGWTKTSDNKTLIEWRTPAGDDISLTVLTATKEGFNSRHVPFLVLDELDLMDGAAFKESRMVPSMYRGIAPLILILSTRKFASGLMESEITRTPSIGGKVFQWNILDVAEHISENISLKHLPMVERYISSQLPMSNLSPQEWLLLEEKDKNKYEQFSAYAGIAEHKMLPVMRNYLVDRSSEDTGYLYKPLTAVHNNFKVTDIEIADAQLLCNKPSSAGLVYGRFNPLLNIMTPEQALTELLGEKPNNTSLEHLHDYLMNLGITFIGGGDWGFTDYTSLVVLALLPGGIVWIVDGMLEKGLEHSDVVKHAKELQEKWQIDKWYVDQNYPSLLVTMRKNGMKCPEFTKVVADGISAVQSKIVDATGVRRLFVIKQPNTERIIQMFGDYKWALDNHGNPTEKPYHDKDGVSDIADSLRYPHQCLFSKGGKVRFTINSDEQKKDKEQTLQEKIVDKNAGLMYGKLKELAPNVENEKKDAKVTKKRIMW
jgi:hypothetical protein